MKKEMNLSHFANEKLNEKLMATLKDFKTWVQVKSPKTLQPLFSYTLDWLSPELLGTGFKINKASEFELQASIPAHKSNLDFHLEVNQGLVANACFEMVHTFIKRLMPESYFQIVTSNLNLIKKQKWNDDLILFFKMSEGQMDEFFVNLQKNKNTEIEFEIHISTVKKNSNKFKNVDTANLKLTIAITELLT